MPILLKAVNGISLVLGMKNEVPFLLVCVLIFNSVLKLMKGAIKDYYALFIFIGIFLVALFTSISTVWLIVASAVLGIVINTVIKKKGGKTD